MARKDELSTLLAKKDDKELERILEQVQALKAQREEEQQAEVRTTIDEKCAELKELAASIGLNFKYDLTAPRGGARAGVTKTRARVPAKYRNPHNPSQTWSGRGIRPKWLRAELEKGRKIEEFLI